MPPVGDVIRGQANHVMRCLGRGHSENIYHRALITAMNKAGISHRSEVSCPIWFMGECIGVGRADMVIDDVVIEIKANRLPPKQTSAQLQKYLVSLSRAENKLFKGVVVNFNQKTGLVDIFLSDDKKPRESELFKRSLISKASGKSNLRCFKYKHGKAG
jgi:GxxExxY protein